jgi:hypothetical protein
LFRFLHNCTDITAHFHGKRELVICEEETVPFSHMHTLFREFREVLEHVFVELGCATVKPEGSLEVYAEHFAMAARMDAGMKDLPVLFEMAGVVEKKWARYLSYVIVFFRCCILNELHLPASDGRPDIRSEAPTLHTYVTHLPRVVPLGNSSADPTQWLFSGHPVLSDSPLHVAVAHLLGYRWPRQSGSGFTNCPALEIDGLEEDADADGIVCLNPVYFGILVSNCRVAIKEQDLRVRVVTDGNLGTNDCRAWLRRSIFEKLSLADGGFYQFRIAAH